MTDLQLQDSQGSSKTKKVFHFFGNYSNTMIKGKFENKNDVMWLKNNEDETKTSTSQKSKIEKRKSNFSVNQKIEKRKPKIKFLSQSKNRKSNEKIKLVSESLSFPRGVFRVIKKIEKREVLSF